MDRERQREAKRLHELWQEFLRTKDDDDFFSYLRTFVHYYNSHPHGDNARRDDDSLQLSNLPENLLMKISSHLIHHNQKENKISFIDEKQLKNVSTVIRSLSTLARNAHNIALIASLSVVSSIYQLLDIVTISNGEKMVKQSIIDFILLLEKLFDPYAVWSSKSHSSTSLQVEVVHQEFPPASVDGVVITFICECCDVPQLDYDLKSKLIDLVGCVISGSERNATYIISEAVVDKLCNALVENNLEVLTIPTGLRRNIFSCLTLMVQTLHRASPEVRQVEVCDIVNKYLFTIESLHTANLGVKSSPELFTPLLDTLRSMVLNQRDIEGLKASFNTANVFDRVTNFVFQFQSSTVTAGLGTLHKTFINFLRTFLRHSKVAKAAFTQSVGYDRLLNVLQVLPPDKGLLTQLINVAVEGDGNESEERGRIENAPIVAMLISWLPRITLVSEQTWLAKTLLDLSCTSDKNRMTCCDNGIVLTALRAVELTSQYIQFTKTTGILMCLVERLGALSITASEIKCLVSLLQLKTVYSPGSFIKRVLKAFAYMTKEQRTGRALSYFSLPGDNSAIKIPDDRKPDWLKRSGFTFHTWLCLEKSLQSGCRRVVYSFQAGNGGFEAFVNFDGYFHVALTTDDRSFHVVDVPDQVLADGKWHMLDVVHSVNGASWKVSIYIDGVLRKKSALASVNLRDKLSYSIGGPVSGEAVAAQQYTHFKSSGRKTSPAHKLSDFLGGIFKKRSSSTDEIPTVKIQAGCEHIEYGSPIGLHGELATVCMFKCCLDSTHILHIFKKGANHMEVFYDTQLRADLVLQFHPKMCIDGRCIDMSSLIKTGSGAGAGAMDGTLVEGHTCLSHSIMDMIKCIGGFQVIIPLLEQVTKESDKTCDQELFEHDASKENSVSSFFQLLAIFITNHEDNEHHLISTNSIPTIGALIQKVDSSLIDEFTLMAVQNLLHDCVKPKSVLYNSLMQYILFDFRIWNNSDKWEVRVGHAQCLYSLITQSGLDLFRKGFGVQFMLDSICLFYCKKAAGLESDIKTVRAALFDIIKFYVKKNITKEELQAILMFIHTVQDDIVVLEAIDMLQSLIESAGDQIHLKLYESDGAIMLYHILVNPDPYLFSFSSENRRKKVPFAIKHAVLKLLITLLCTSKVLEGTKKGLRMEEYGMGGLVSLLQPLKSPHDKLSLQLMEIVCKQAPDPICLNILSVVSLARFAVPATKLNLAKMLQQVMSDKPSAVTEIVQCEGWQGSISCLLKTDTQGSRDNRRNFILLPQEAQEPFILVNADDEEPGKEVHMGPSPSESYSSASFDSLSPPQSPMDSLLPNDSIDEPTGHVCNEGCSGCSVQTELQAILLDIHCKLLWDGLCGSSQKIWKERLKVLYSIKSAKGTVYVNRVGYTRLLIEYLLTKCCSIVKDHTPAEANGMENGQQLIHVIADFLNMYHEDEQCYSKDLLELTLDLLMRMTVWHQTSGWPELARVGLNIILVFIRHKSNEFCATACSKLNHLIQADELRSESEIHYIINSIHNTLQSSESDDNHVHILQVMIAVLEKNSSMLEMSVYLPQLWSSSRVNGGRLRLGEDVQLFNDTDWDHFIDTVVKERKNHCVRLLKQVEQEMLNLWNEVEDEYNSDWHRCQRKIGESQLLFKSFIITPLNSAIDNELRRYTSRNSSLSQSVKLVLYQWRSRMRFFSSKRGTWVNRADSEVIHWKMSSHENYCRMRIKLIPDDHFDDHMDASHARDTNDPPPLNNPLENVKLEAPFQGFNADDDDGSFGPSVTNPGEENTDDTKTRPEELLLRVECELITMMDPVQGRLEITNKCIYFFELSPSVDEIGKDFISLLSGLRNVHHRLHKLQRTGLEFFTHDTNYFLNFSREDRKKVLRVIRREKRNDVKFKMFEAQLLANTNLTTRWVRREISNFEYLMQLNTIAGRTYNDWSQYPVFPWVLVDYKSSSLDLSNPTSYRDFTKPAGAMHPPIERDLRQRFEEFDDPGGMEAFHHGTHYSSAAGVVTHFLVRMEPFTAEHINLQNGRFDIADRLFFSVEESFNSVLTSLHDCKELTPDFFCLPEFLININDFDLGRPQGDVVLPNWSQKFSSSPGDKMRTADDFIWKHRKALESDHVSSQLHHWIDLIFGYKQRGEEAKRACNVYPAYSYEGAYDLSQMKDPKQKAITEKIIKEFGQTPIQLIDKAPHPQRKTQEECLALEIREARPSSILPYLDNLKCYMADVHMKSDTGNIIVACVPPSQAKPFIGAEFDILVTISDQGYIGMHRWQPVDRAIVNKFVFNRDPLVDNGNKRLVGPFIPGKLLEPKLLAVSADAERVYTGGYWDNSLRVYSLNSAGGNNRLKHIPAHYGVVTCLHLAATGEHLVTGSADTTCKIWEVTTLNETSKPLQTLYGHDDEVTCVFISTEYDMVVSGSKDGTINIHTVRKGMFMHSLCMPREFSNSQLVVKEIALSNLAHIIVYAEEGAHNSSQTVHSLLRYSINGHFLDRLLLSKQTVSTQLVTAQNYLIYGTAEGHLYVREIHRFAKINKISVQKPVRCVSVAYSFITKKHSHILVGLEDAPSMMIVLTRNSEPELRRSIMAVI